MARDAQLNAKVTVQGADAAERQLDDIAEAAEQVEKPVEVKVESNMTSVISALDDVREEALKTQAAAEKLAISLGPELAAKADTAQIVGELRNLGLTFDEIEADAEQLGGKLKELADADVGGKLGSSLGTARGQLDEFGKSADSSKSVMANMVGNTTQDLGALGGVAGSTGVAIGQMGEYMADALSAGEGFGGVAKNFLAVSGPIAALALGAELLGNVMTAVAERSKTATDQQKAWVEALRSGGDAASQYAQHLRDAGQIMAAVGDNKGYRDVQKGWLGAATQFGAVGLAIDAIGDKLGVFGQKTEDMTTRLARSGITAETWAQAVTSGEAGVTQMATALDRLGASSDDQNKIMEALTDEQDSYAKSTERAAVLNEVFGKSTERSGDALSTMTKEYDRVLKARQAATASIEEERAALQQLADDQVTSADSSIALVEANKDFTDATADTIDVLKDRKSTSEDIRRAVDAERDAAIDAAKATVQYGLDHAAAEGRVLSAKDQVDALSSSLLSSAKTATPEAAAAILSYVGEVNKIPPEKATEIQALIDQGRYDEAIAMMADAVAARTATVYAETNAASVRTTIAQLDQAAKDRYVSFIATSPSGWYLGSSVMARVNGGGTP